MLFQKVLLIFGTILLINTVIADFPNDDQGPRVCLEDGCLRGKYFPSQTGKRYDAFLGVPYAKPPIGKLRFRNPQPLEPWTDDYNATFERSPCVQKNDLWVNQKVYGDEDCLYVNVYVPNEAKITAADESGLAVLVYIHGGGYFAGSASKGEFGPDRFMDLGDVILVVMQYRLGVFGFLSTGDHAASGNFGLKDQNAVLKWVKRNIGRFGGNPDLVTLFGQSAGGASVQMHMMSPLSRGLFARAWILSGSTLGFWTKPIEDHLKFAQQQAAVVGIDSPELLSSEELVEALRQVNAKKLAASIDKLKFWHTYPLTPYHPNVEKYVDDETFISEDPFVLWASGNYAQVPWTASYVPNEGAFGSLVIVTNKTLLDELNQHSAAYIPRMIGCPENEKSRRMLRERFFPGGTEDRWITEENAQNIQDLFTEAFIMYPLLLSVKQHIALGKPDKSPIAVRQFKFAGSYSHSKYFTKTDGKFGVCHSDDLIYLFRAEKLFPDFEPESPEWTMAEALVSIYSNFAYDGIRSSSCFDDNCLTLVYTNSDNPEKAYKLDHITGFDEEMIQFWTEIYS